MSSSSSPPVLSALSSIVKMSVTSVTTRPVFAHYMVGQMAQDQAVTDVTEAKAMGFDAFALNIISMDSWSTEAVKFLFQAALAIGFHLFFSFDMTHFQKASDMFPLIQQYASNGAYYNYGVLPFVSKYTLCLNIPHSVSCFPLEVLRRSPTFGRTFSLFHTAPFPSTLATESNLYQAHSMELN